MVARGLAFGPEGLAGAGVEGDEAECDGFVEGFAVHVAEHEDTQGGGVLDDDGKKPVGAFIEIEVGKSHSSFKYRV